MTTFTLPERELPLEDSFDVIVVGAGPAGCAAAIAAAEEGRRVLLLERNCTPGGMGTAALIPAWCPFSDGQRQIHRGIAGRILAQSLAGTPHLPPTKLDWIPIPHEHLKQVYDQELARAGVEVRYETFVVDALRTQRRITTLLTTDKRGLRALQASIYIDATGDADLITRVGHPVHKGDDDGGELMPATLCFVLANVKGFEEGRWPSYQADATGQTVIQRMRADTRFTAIPDEHLVGMWIGPGCMAFNAGHIYVVDPTDPASMARGLTEGRHLAQVYQRALATYLPESFAHAFLASTGSVLGIRETRRIVADYELTTDDYLARRSFPDDIARNAYFLDQHPRRAEGATDAGWVQRVHSSGEKYKPGESHGIPYRSLCPRDLDNVLVAGRCIGTDRAVNGSVRVMPVCLNTGEAAGVAASLACTCSADIRGFDVQQLRSRLLARGAYLQTVTAKGVPDAI